MAGSVADINIKLIANPKGLIDGLSAAEKRLSKFASESKASARAAAAGFTDIGTALTGMSVALTGGAVAAGIKGAIDRLDDLGDKAAGIGETAGNLSRLDYVATRMGSNGDAASAGMNKLVKAIGEAQNGSGDAKKVFDSLGLSIQSLAQMSPTDAMLTVSEAIGRLPGVYEKASAASAIFGKNFAALMPLFNNPDGISEYYDDFARLHGNIDQAAEVAGAAKDQFDRLETAMHGLGEMAVIAFGPAVESMIGAVADRIGEINSSDSGMQKAAEYGQKFAHAFDDMPGKVGDIAEVFQSIARFTKEAMGATKILVSGLLYMKSNISQNALLTTFPVLRNYIDEYPDVKYYKDMADALYKEGQQNIFDAAGMSAAKATAKIDEIGVSAEESGYTVSDSAEKMRIGLDSVGDAAEDADKKISNIGTSAPSTPSDGWSWDKVRQGMMGDLPIDRKSTRLNSSH